MKTKISTHKLQDRLWKILIGLPVLQKGYDSGHIWDISGEMLEDVAHPMWNNISRRSLTQIICNL